VELNLEFKHISCEQESQQGCIDTRPKAR